MNLTQSMIIFYLYIYILNIYLYLIHVMVTLNIFFKFVNLVCMLMKGYVVIPKTLLSVMGVC